MKTKAVVTGAGGFIGSHLVTYLKAEGYWVRGVDAKWPEFSQSDADEFIIADLRQPLNCLLAVRDMDEVYHLAADMGGIGYITRFHAAVSRNNVLMDANMLWAADDLRVGRYFYSSSACVYPQDLQTSEASFATGLVGLAEDTAHPADPEPGYGWEKLYAELMAGYWMADHGLDVRIARFHNIYGPFGTFEGGREKAPAALCRKAALADDPSVIEVWGDGQQTRSFTYIDDCVEGIHRIMQSDYPEPLNLGSDEMVSIDHLADLIIACSGKDLMIRYEPGEPQGVRARNSDNSRASKVLGWVPSTRLADGIAATYDWIANEVAHRR